MDKFAVVKINEEQFVVEEGKTYSIKGFSHKKGEKFESKDVFMTCDGTDVKVGKPIVDGASVSFEVVSQKKGKKLDIFKYKSKARYRRSYGSRELLTTVKVLKIKY